MLAAALAVLLLSGATHTARADAWIASWAASDAFPVGQDFNYQTLRQIVRLSAGGKQVRVRFSNETGYYPLVIGAAHIAKPVAETAAGGIRSCNRPSAALSAGAAELPWLLGRRRCRIPSTSRLRHYPS